MDRTYMRANFARFPLSFFGTLAVWVLAAFIGGIVLLAAVIWSVFFACLITLTVSQARRLGKPQFDPSLCVLPNIELQKATQQLYDMSYDELVEQYTNRCRLVKTKNNSQIIDLALVSEARLKKVLHKGGELDGT